ncbi:putative dna mismatch repair protein msh1 [Phaeomoniella chlamydospora]|uniref:DNA mismatch repair protein MSH3 n=1 Tax=Phaeomoniella chlamydospora TaxID=158046 RepID=A0A0G2GP08_PHACM|nr:putative dna mismatch repair protein msh1 [Phaeomoniella chlamydospora]
MSLSDAVDNDSPQYPAVVQGARNNMAKFKDCVLLTRVGKFYELYLEQAEEYAPLLDIKLASKKTNMGRVAMAGFPHMQLDKYLKVLVQELNKNVAISEEYPIPPSRKATSGGLLFDRIVKRVVTPGTLIDESFLDPLRNNYLLAFHLDFPTENTNDLSDQRLAMLHGEASVGLAWTDLSTGQFFLNSTTLSGLPTSLARINAREILLDPNTPRAILETCVPELFAAHVGHTLTYLKPDNAEFQKSSWDQMFEVGLSEDLSINSAEGNAMNLLLTYAQSNVDATSLKLQSPIRPNFRDIMAIDRSSLRGLEILETSRDGLHQGSLLHAVRRTITKGGARLLRAWLTTPSASLPEIESRHDLVSALIFLPTLRQDLTSFLRRTHDTIRLIQRIALNRSEPDDLICLARAIQATEGIHDALFKALRTDSEIPAQQETVLRSLASRIDLYGPLELSKRITEAIDEDGLDQMHRQEEEAELDAIDLTKRALIAKGTEEDMEVLPSKSRRSRPVSTKEQNISYEDTWIMRRTASAALRKLHKELGELRSEKDELTQRLQEQLKAPSLTLKWSPTLGYFAHVKGADKASLDHLNARVVSSSKSTKSLVLSGWSRLGADMDQVKSHIRDEELKVLHKLRDEVRQNIVKLRSNASVLDEVDVASSFALLAKENHLVRPIMNEGTRTVVYGGRHPTVELGLAKSGRQFVRNDCSLGMEEQIWLVTGPNMAGKSTFLRQNALITILAQVGSFVPAEYAELGIVDKIFSRVGAADDLFRDQSTFMVEMLETAEILKNSTPRSFVIMDEVGRGTSPKDGMSIAYACLHHLHYINKCRTLFATHFHDLADMTRAFDRLACYCTRVDAEDGSFSFVHRLEKGVNREPHALDVARLAGLPEQALSTAAATLVHLNERRLEASSVQYNTSYVAKIGANN